jgi:hypothetical protein
MFVLLYLVAYIDKTNIGMSTGKTDLLHLLTFTRQCEDRGPSSKSTHERNTVQHRLVNFFHTLCPCWYEILHARNQ